NVPPDPKDLPQFLNEELSHIERAQQEPVFFLSLAVSNVAPTKVRDGMVVLADGTNWNPGSGGGYYGYRAGAWRFLG
ncbi:MAG: hypothetical protein KGI52_02575, partial [Burkholderiales bacterium]|nr:hypothetical protein [Burkholderiales bacterium]